MKNKVRVYRAEWNWTQSDLANRVGVSRQTIHAIEKGNYIPSAVLALKIAQIFDVEIKKIFELEEEDWD